MHACSEQIVISDDILPFNSVSDNTIHEREYRDCVVLEGMFKIEDKLWAVIYKNSKLNPKYYPYILKRNTCIIRHLNSCTCLLNFKYHRYIKKEDRIVIYAACKHNSYRCKKFKTYVKDVTGVEKNVIKQKLQTKEALPYKKEAILQPNRQLAEKSGNLMVIKSDCTMRKLKSLASLDRSKNDMLDMMYLREEPHLWPAVSGIVTDFSFANLHEICKASNRYIQICYDQCSKKNFVDKNLVKVHLCCAYSIKTICDDIDQIAKSDTHRRDFKEMVVPYDIVD
nr:unnamed protein product [Callosobruchus chinensis]